MDTEKLICDKLSQKYKTACKCTDGVFYVGVINVLALSYEKAMEEILNIDNKINIK